MFESIIKPLTAWLHMHPHYAGMITFLISFSESLAIVGTIIPGSVTMTAIGILVGSGVIEALPTFVFATLGAIAGDGASFWLGRHYHEEIKRLWPFSKYPGLFLLGEKFFEKHGGKSVFIGRFTGPIRSIIPVVAGMLNMNSRDFVIANVLSAIGWSIAHITPGIFLGAAALELSPEAATRFVILVLGSLIALWLSTWLLKWISLTLLKKSDNWIDIAWKYMRQHPNLVWLTRVMQDPTQPDQHRQLVLATTILLCGVGLLALIVMVNHRLWITDLNEPLYYLFQGIRTPHLDDFFVCTTFFAEHEVLFGVIGIGALYFVIMRQWAILAHWLLNSGLVILLTRGLKFAISYPRPADIMVIRPTASFPSGHVTIFTALVGLIAYLIARELPEGTRRMVYLPLVIFIMLEAIARLYLGAHWFTDILGSMLIGGLCVFVTVLSYQRFVMPAIRPLTFLAVCTASLIAGWAIFTPSHFKEQVAAYTPLYPMKHIAMRHWWLQKEPILPLLRQNRLGRPVAPLNIQFAGVLDTFVNALVEQGWENVGKADFYTTVNRIAAQDKTQLLPAISQLYRNQQPVITLTKKQDEHRPLLILQLWRAGAAFTDGDTSLWVGSINYREIWHYQWRHHEQSSANNLPDPLTLLEPQLKDFESRHVRYRDNSTPITILLVKEQPKEAQ